MPTKWVSLDQARAGDRLALDVQGSAGELLLKAGVELSERAMAMLVQRGVDRVPVQVASDPERLEQEQARIEAALAHRFRHCDDDSVMRSIREVTMRVMLANLEAE